MTDVLRPTSIMDSYPDIPRGHEPWSEPEMFDLSSNADQLRLEERLADGEVTSIHDPLPVVARAIFEYEHPEAKGNEGQFAEYFEHVQSQGDAFGTWVRFPWSGVVARFPEKDDHQKLRTSRNPNLVTTQEQTRLLNTTVAVLGLSVGSKALSSLLEGGVGGRYVIADADHLDPTNTNRIDAGFTEVGESKIDIASKKISEKDPWVEQVRLTDGVTLENVTALAEADLIVEEVDNLAIKALVRLLAAEHGIPLLMATDLAHKSVIDVERYDTDNADKIMFAGKISPEVASDISSRPLGPQENMKLMFKHVGARDLTTRMMKSVLAIGRELGGLPQLGMTATKGGADVTFAAREILLGNPVLSGRYVDNPRKTFKMPRFESPVSEGISTIRTVLKQFK